MSWPHSHTYCGRRRRVKTVVSPDGRTDAARKDPSASLACSASSLSPFIPSAPASLLSQDLSHLLLSGELFCLYRRTSGAGGQASKPDESVGRAALEKIATVGLLPARMWTAHFFRPVQWEGLSCGFGGE